MNEPERTVMWFGYEDNPGWPAQSTVPVGGILSNVDGFYFVDETGSMCCGPYESEAAVKEALREYGDTL